FAIHVAETVLLGDDELRSAISQSILCRREVAVNQSLSVLLLEVVFVRCVWRNQVLVEGRHHYRYALLLSQTHLREFIEKSPKPGVVWLPVRSKTLNLEREIPSLDVGTVLSHDLVENINIRSESFRAGAMFVRVVPPVIGSPALPGPCDPGVRSRLYVRAQNRRLLPRPVATNTPPKVDSAHNIGRLDDSIDQIVVDSNRRQGNWLSADRINSRLRGLETRVVVCSTLTEVDD